MSRNIVITNRGDTVKLLVEVTNYNREPYKLSRNDAVYFGLMDPHQLFEDALIKRKYTKDDVYGENFIDIVLNPEDTVDLYPGIYYYTVKLCIRPDDESKPEEVITLINKTKFIIND